MRYNHTENPSKSFLLAEGEGNFEVLEAEELLSKKNNEMIKLSLQVWDSDGNKSNLFDYLIALDSMNWKTKHFCESVGKADWYSASNPDINAVKLVGLTGKCVIKTEKAKVVNGKEYDARSKIDDYIKAGESLTSPVSDELDDDLPF